MYFSEFVFCSSLIVKDTIRKSHINIVQWILINVVNSFRAVPHENKGKLKKTKSVENTVRVLLLFASEEQILLLHLLHAEAGGPVLLGLTLLLCGPVLHPGPLTQDVLEPAEGVAQVGAGSAHGQGTRMLGSRGELTSGLGRPCECLWTSPWGGRSSLWSGLRTPCSAGNWGTGAAFPEEPRRSFLRGEAAFRGVAC